MSIVLALFLAFATGGRSAPVSNPKTIQSKLDSMPRGNGIVRGDAPIGGTVELDSKIIRLSRPILLGSAQELVGRGPSTIIEWSGPPGTSAILIRSFADHRYVHLPAIRDLTVWCPNGADAIALDGSARHVEKLELSNVTIRGGRINLPGEHYFCRFDNVRFTALKGQAVRLDGQGHTFRAIALEPNAKLPEDAAVPLGMIEIHGSATFGDWCRLEGAYQCPLLYAADWNRWPGRITVPGSWWFEPHRDGPAGVLINTCFYGPELYGRSHFRWTLINASAYLDVPCDPAGVETDATSAVYVGTERIRTSDLAR